MQHMDFIPQLTMQGAYMSSAHKSITHSGCPGVNAVCYCASLRLPMCISSLTHRSANSAASAVSQEGAACSCCAKNARNSERNMR